MTKEEAKQMLPIIQAYSEGKEIEMLNHSNIWVKATLPDFTLSPENNRIKPKPKYRPFKSQQECFKEMNCHPDFGWLIIVETGEEATVEAVHSNKIILTNDFECLFKDAFKCYKFTDNTPFGIKDE